MLSRQTKIDFFVPWSFNLVVRSHWWMRGSTTKDKRNWIFCALIVYTPLNTSNRVVVACVGWHGIGEDAINMADLQVFKWPSLFSIWSRAERTFKHHICTWREGYSAAPSSIIILIIVSPCTLPYIIILSPNHHHHQVRRRGKPYSASWTRRSPQSLPPPPPPPQAPRPTGRPSATASSWFLRSGDKHLALILSLVRLSLSLEGFKPFSADVQLRL